MSLHHTKTYHWHRKVWLHRLLVGIGDWSVAIRWSSRARTQP